MPLKPFSEFLKEDSPNATTTKASVMSTIVSNFQRFANSADSDNGALIMLTAALAMLNASDSSYALQSAKRLSQMAATRAGKSKSPDKK